jgi:hypothetical protein
MPTTPAAKEMIAAAVAVAAATAVAVDVLER